MTEETCFWCDNPANESLGRIEPHLMPLSAYLYHGYCANKVMDMHKQVRGKEMPL